MPIMKGCSTSGTLQKKGAGWHGRGQVKRLEALGGRTERAALPAGLG